MGVERGRLTRRGFLQAGALATGGLVISAQTSWPAQVADDSARRHAATPPPRAAALTAWVKVTPDNLVTIVVSQAEIGQGISTTLPALIADELGADWSRVRFEIPPFDPAYRNPKNNWMFTGNSESTQSFYTLMRTMGAAAREMLIAAAANRWHVPPDSCRAEKSRVIHTATQRTVTFGALATEAAALPVPQAPRLKSDRELTLIGKSLPRVDVPAKVDGSAVFGIDFQLPGLLHAAVRTGAPVGSTLRRYDDSALKSKPGVHAVVRLDNGVAVVADTYWQARSALSAIPVEHDDGPNVALNSDALRAEYRRRLEEGPFATPVSQGDPDSILKDSASVVQFDYESPFLAHATLEPMNCTARVTADSCEIWAPTQGQELAFVTLKRQLGLRDEQIRVNRTPYAGGGFGRRLLPDFVLQAAQIAKAVDRPVKTIWDREEDMRRDSYRPGTFVRLTAGMDGTGVPRALAARVVSPTILLPVFPAIAPVLEKNRFDPSCLEGMLEWPYGIEHRRVDFHLLSTPIPTSVMRTTGYGPNIFALESFIDELAHASRADPYEYRRRLLANDARSLKVLDRAAELGRWGKPLTQGSGRGIAFSHAFGSVLAQVVELQMTDDEVQLRHVVTVVDCGRVLDPRIAAAGVEGGVVFGLAACKSEVTFRGGAVEQSNFTTYEMPYLAETPELVTELIQSGAALGGVGEVSPVTVAPALANAIFAASGRRLRSMPLRRHGLRFGAAQSRLSA